MKNLRDMIARAVKDGINEALDSENRNRIVHGHYYVADCEHEGDMRRAYQRVKETGVTITDSYWDGYDCGEAYIEFETPFRNCYYVYKRLGSCVSFADASLSEIMPDTTPNIFKRLSDTEYRQIVKQYTDTPDLENCLLAIHLDIYNNECLEDALESLEDRAGTKLNIIGVNKHYSDSGYWVWHILAVCKMEELEWGRGSELGYMFNSVRYAPNIRGKADVYNYYFIQRPYGKSVHKWTQFKQDLLDGKFD